MLKVLEPHYSQTFDKLGLCMVYEWRYWLVEHFTQYHPYPFHDLKVKVIDLEFLC